MMTSRHSRANVIERAGATAQTIPPTFDARYNDYRARAERALTRLFAAREADAADLHAAMRYAALGAGKRLRAALVYACGELAGARAQTLDAPAAAIECMHAYSLVHDDLPAMDDDALRRGRATCHIEFDEATAILAGDALQSLAFAALAESQDLRAPQCVQMLRELARAAGVHGMAGGQALDMQMSERAAAEKNPAALRRMHRLKTGALIRAAVRLGALAGRANDKLVAQLDAYAEHFGVLFQIKDDILDATGDLQTLGKSPGADVKMQKTTFVTTFGLEQSRECAAQALADATACARAIDGGEFLIDLAHYARARDK